MAKVSVIIPAFNVEKYITTTLESLLVQKYSDFEIICVEDCSEDKTVKIIKNFANRNKKIKLIQNEKHLGPGECRNIALNNANGKYIACVDADDIVTKEYLSLPINKLEETNINAVWCKANIYWEDEKRTTEMFTFPILQKEKEGFLELTPNNISNYPAYAWNKFFKKDCIDESIKWSNGLLFEDVEFYYRFYTQNPNIYVIDKPLYIYRRHKSSIMSKSIVDINYHKDLFTVTENIYNFLKEKDLFKKYKKSLLKLFMQNVNDFDKFPNLKTELAKTVVKTLKNINFPSEYEDLK